MSTVRALVFLTGVALTAALLIQLAHYERPLAEVKQAEKYFYLAIGVFALAAPLALFGVVLTFAYLRWPRASKALLPATLFIVIAPLAKGLTFRLPAK